MGSGKSASSVSWKGWVYAERKAARFFCSMTYPILIMVPVPVTVTVVSIFLVDFGWPAFLSYLKRGFAWKENGVVIVLFIKLCF
jgi:hypothetical protein